MKRHIQPEFENIQRTIGRNTLSFGLCIFLLCNLQEVGVWILGFGGFGWLEHYLSVVDVRKRDYDCLLSIEDTTTVYHLESFGL